MSFFLRLATFPHEIRPFFALPVSVIIVHVDLCCFFQQVRTQRVFPSPLLGSNVLIDPDIETVSRFGTD